MTLAVPASTRLYDQRLHGDASVLIVIVLMYMPIWLLQTGLVKMHAFSTILPQSKL